MDLGLRDRSFIVTGGSRGLGRAIAEQLVSDGARVLLVARDETSLTRAGEELGPGASGLVADLTAPGTPDRVAAAAKETFGQLDGLLLSGGGPVPGKALELRDSQWRDAFELLVGGPVRLVRALVPLLRDGASVLFVNGSAYRQPIPGLDASNVLRPAVAGLAKSLARELAPRIRVNSIAAGRVATERVRSLDEARAAALGITVEEQQGRAQATIPLGRYGDPAEFGQVAAFLLSPAASYVSGTSILVDGGLVDSLP